MPSCDVQATMKLFFFSTVKKGHGDIEKFSSAFDGRRERSSSIRRGRVINRWLAGSNHRSQLQRPDSETRPLRYMRRKTEESYKLNLLLYLLVWSVRCCSAPCLHSNPQQWTKYGVTPARVCLAIQLQSEQRWALIQLCREKYLIKPDLLSLHHSAADVRSSEITSLSFEWRCAPRQIKPPGQDRAIKLCGDRQKWWHCWAGLCNVYRGRGETGTLSSKIVHYIINTR